MDSKEMKLKLAEKLKTAQNHRTELCEYLNTPSRLKDEEICKRVDKLLLEFRQIGRYEERVDQRDTQERKTENKEKVSII